MPTRKDIADKLFPNVTQTIADLEKEFPIREQEICSRFAPSPTGYLHIGGVYSSFVARKFVKQNNGIFILRIEDTDQKRIVDDAIDHAITSLRTFDMPIHEGPLGPEYSDIGNHGPYIQSKRKHIYEIFVKELISQGKAYPCWMSGEEIDEIRNNQMRAKTMTGIYGNYSIRRNKSTEEIEAHLNKNNDFVIRFRSHGDTQKKITFDDVLRGKVNMIDNYNDIVLIKSDGLPTYHLAHIADDHLMRVSHIIRAEEWLTSVPLHLQLFEAFGIQAPQYCHLAQLLKVENGKKRKLSKRKDPEADVGYFFKEGYSTQGLIEYLLTIIDSSYEERQKANPKKSYIEYDIKLEKMNKSGAIFDLTKARSVNNEYLSRISTEELYYQTLERAKLYKPELAVLMERDPDYVKMAIGIERFTPQGAGQAEKDPKRFYTFNDIYDQIRFFFDNEREQMLKDIETPFIKGVSDEVGGGIGKKFIQEYIEKLDLNTDTQSRFQQLKDIGKKYGFAANNKEFKEGGYIGKVGELAMFLRLQLCASPKTPDLFSVMKVMGKDRVVERLQKAL